MEDEHMWLIPFSSGAEHRLTIQLPTEHTLTGLRVWNYNKSPEDTYRGVRQQSQQHASERGLFLYSITR